jgi:photosystem II stability/assembly factor-like uncharacterized protein
MSRLVKHCSEQMPVEVLSGWRDRTLGPGLRHRVDDHIRTCRACQHYLEEYEQDAQRLRRLPSPAVQSQVWRSLENRIHLPTSRQNRWRRALIGSGIAIATVGIIVIFALVLSIYPNRAGSASYLPTGTAHLGQTPTAQTTTTTTATQSWKDIATLNFGKSVAFAANDALTGYVCGNNPPSGTSAPLQIAVTHDGGDIWQSISVRTTIPQVACKISINPQNAQELAMTTSQCWKGCTGSGLYGPDLYRSFDGGQTWTKQNFPTQGGTEGMSAPVWLGNAFFEYTDIQVSDSIAPPQRGTHSIAVSLNGGALNWVNDAPVFAGITDLSVEVTNAYAYQGGYYVELNGKIYRTSDAGTTWSRITYPGNVSGILVGADGKTLYGFNATNQSVRSSDGGQTWTAFSVPANTGQFMTTPDGTLYLLQNDPSSDLTVKTILKQTQGSSQWISVAAIDPLQSPTLTWATVSWDAQGHPKQLWATEATIQQAKFASYASLQRPASAAGIAPGISKHAP